MMIVGKRRGINSIENNLKRYKEVDKEIDFFLITDYEKQYLNHYDKFIFIEKIKHRILEYGY